jgi:hypothetical protein
MWMVLPKMERTTPMSWSWLIVAAGTVIGLALLITDLLQSWPWERLSGRGGVLAALGRAVERARKEGQR